MQVLDATMRHRELTQEVFNIGDELAEHAEHIAEAIADWDAELVEDCLLEFETIVAEARHDVRAVVAELVGLRQALTSGLASGTVGVTVDAGAVLAAPPLRKENPVTNLPASVQDVTRQLDERTEAAGEDIEALVEWVLHLTERGARDLASCSLPVAYARFGESVRGVATAWLESVARAHPVYARAKRGSHPPVFLAERARVDAVVARVRSRRKQVPDVG